MHLTKTLKSQEDDSVNFVFEGDFPGYLEARYVKRSPEYFVVYLSTQTGCMQACQFCHLTATKQTDIYDAEPKDIITQAKEVIEYYNKVEIVHFNFMARGEFFDNRQMLAYGHSVLVDLGVLAQQRSLIPKFKISTIMPKNMPAFANSLVSLFPLIHPDIYYSIYSVDENFRKKWLPKAMPVQQALEILKRYQDQTGKIVKLHWAFIEGENDSEKDVQAICEAVNKVRLRVDVNIVRYNPYSEIYGREPIEGVIHSNMKVLRQMLPLANIKLIKRVGFDVKASCGMFIEKSALQAQVS